LTNRFSEGLLWAEGPTAGAGIKPRLFDAPEMIRAGREADVVPALLEAPAEGQEGEYISPSAHSAERDGSHVS